MTGQGRAFVLHKAKELGVEDRPVQTLDGLPGDHVLVRPSFTGICGSDVHYAQTGRCGDFIVKEPMILGHESSGIVIALGKDLPESRRSLKVGDPVALEPGATCKTCVHCRRGAYELCPDIRFAATPPYDGTLQSAYALPAEVVYKLPESMTLEDGAMIEPLAVAVQAVARVGQLQPNQNVAIFGAGPVGLLCLAVAKAFNARRIAVADINEERLAFARSYGATDTVTPARPPPASEGPEALAQFAEKTVSAPAPSGFNAQLRGPDAFDLVLDCTGAPVCIATGISLTAEGGTFVQVGMGVSNVTIPMSSVLTKMMSIKGSFRYGAGVYDLAISLVARGLIDLKPLVTHRYSFEEAPAAFKAMVDGKGSDGKAPIKVLIAGVEA